LEGVAVDRTFTDTASGKDTQRPQLAALISFVREGDTLIVHSMDRLARNLDDLRRLVRELIAKACASSSSRSSSPSPATTPPWRPGAVGHRRYPGKVVSQPTGRLSRPRGALPSRPLVNPRSLPGCAAHLSSQLTQQWDAHADEIA